MLIDRGSVEVFVNDCAESVSSLSFPNAGSRSVVLSSESGSIVVSSLRVHTLTGIWETPDDRWSLPVRTSLGRERCCGGAWTMLATPKPR